MTFRSLSLHTNMWRSRVLYENDKVSNGPFILLKCFSQCLSTAYRIWMWRSYQKWYEKIMHSLHSTSSNMYFFLFFLFPLQSQPFSHFVVVNFFPTTKLQFPLPLKWEIQWLAANMCMCVYTVYFPHHYNKSIIVLPIYITQISNGLESGRQRNEKYEFMYRLYEY